MLLFWVFTQIIEFQRLVWLEIRIGGPGNRGRRSYSGIGRLLLHTALRHAFQAAQRDAVNLCVNDVNVGALRLYESCGFGRLYSGASLRWLRHGDEPATGAPAA